MAPDDARPRVGPGDAREIAPTCAIVSRDFADTMSQTTSTSISGEHGAQPRHREVDRGAGPKEFPVASWRVDLLECERLQADAQMLPSQPCPKCRAPPTATSGGGRSRHCCWSALAVHIASASSPDLVALRRTKPGSLRRGVRRQRDADHRSEQLVGTSALGQPASREAVHDPRPAPAALPPDRPVTFGFACMRFRNSALIACSVRRIRFATAVWVATVVPGWRSGPRLPEPLGDRYDPTRSYGCAAPPARIRTNALTHTARHVESLTANRSDGHG